jgi:hypothetical protein
MCSPFIPPRFRPFSFWIWHIIFSLMINFTKTNISIFIKTIMSSLLNLKTQIFMTFIKKIF